MGASGYRGDNHGRNDRYAGMSWTTTLMIKKCHPMTGKTTLDIITRIPGIRIPQRQRLLSFLIEEFIHIVIPESPPLPDFLPLDETFPSHDDYVVRA